MTSHLLARFRVAPAGFPEPTLYVRHRDGMIDDEGLHLMRGGRATFDTTFGVFSAGRWSRLTDIQDVIVRINATGRVRVELMSYADGVDTVIGTSESDNTVRCEGFRELSAESLYVRHRDGMIDGEGLHLMRGGRATFDTTFGVFSAG
ncbi:MAG: Galactofuranosyltransferase 2 N-terminal, partial [Actinomycetota bacterium]